jgi:hypothetical protein
MKKLDGVQRKFEDGEILIPPAKSTVLNLHNDILRIFDLWNWSLFNCNFMRPLEDDCFHRFFRHDNCVYSQSPSLTYLFKNSINQSFPIRLADFEISRSGINCGSIGGAVCM